MTDLDYLNELLDYAVAQAKHHQSEANKYKSLIGDTRKSINKLKIKELCGKEQPEQSKKEYIIT